MDDLVSSNPPKTQMNQGITNQTQQSDVTTSSASQQQRMQQPPTHTPGIYKEYSPLPSLAPEIKVGENEQSVTFSEPEMILPPELIEVGAEVGNDVKEQAFFEAMQKASAELSIDQQPNQFMQIENYPQQVLPMAYTEAAAIRKKGKVWDSFTWFATLIMYQWKKLNSTGLK